MERFNGTPNTCFIANDWPAWRAALRLPPPLRILNGALPAHAFCCGALPRDWHIADMPAALVDVRTWVEWEREVTKYQPELFYRALADANAMRVAAASMELAITFAVRGNLK